MHLLESIDQQLGEMIALVEKWANINSYFANPAGIANLLDEVQIAFARLNPDEMRIVHFPNSSGLFLKKRSQAPMQVFLGGHLDTVFPPYSPFQTAIHLDKDTLQGPGVADMKGGLVVMLKALETFEQMESATNLGWEIFLNADEETGSPGSTPFIEACAKRCHLACIFEPTFEDGALVSRRKGSSNYTVYSHGKKAHAGRNPLEGKNAIYPLAHFMTHMETLNVPSEGILVNVGVMKGGEVNNTIPDYAECSLNIRADLPETMEQLNRELHHCAEKYALRVVKTSFRPPKVLDAKTEALFHLLQKCAAKIGLHLTWRASGGVCDGNVVASNGIPTIDTLGVHGGKLHTENEYVHLRSLSERAQLTALFLNEIALGRSWD